MYNCQKTGFSEMREILRFARLCEAYSMFKILNGLFFFSILFNFYADRDLFGVVCQF